MKRRAIAAMVAGMAGLLVAGSALGLPEGGIVGNAADSARSIHFDEIAVEDAGTGLNISPDPTSIVSTPIARFDELVSNYGRWAVDGVIDRDAGTFDVDGDSRIDYFLSFAISFQEIVDALVAQRIGFDQDSEFPLVAGTSTQGNARNDDLSGPDAGISSSETWTDIGGFSNNFSLGDILAVPEPDAAVLFGLGIMLLGVAGRRR